MIEAQGRADEGEYAVAGFIGPAGVAAGRDRAVRVPDVVLATLGHFSSTLTQEDVPVLAKPGDGSHG
jgi:hypothetical protein